MSLKLSAEQLSGNVTSRQPPGHELRHILANSGQLIAGRSIAGVLQFVTLALIARHLGTLGFGQWGYALAFVSFFSAAMDLGLSTLVMRDLSLRSTKESTYLGSAVILKLVIGLLAAASALAVERLVNDDSEARVLIWLLGGHMLVSSVTEFLYAMFRVRERLISEIAIRAGQGSLVLLAVFALTATGASAPALAAAYFLASIVACAVATGLARRLFTLTIVLEPAVARRLIGEVWPLGAGLLMTSVYYYFDTVYMGTLGQTEAVGWYTAAYMFVLWIVVLVSGLRSAFLPSQSRALIGGTGRQVLLGAYCRVSLCAAIVVPVGGFLFARPMLLLFYGSEFEPGTFALQMLMVMGGFMFLSSFFGSNLIVLGRQKLYLAGVTVGAVVNVCLNLVLIPRYSLDGAAVATLASEAAVFLCMAALNARLIPQLRLRDVVTLPLKAGVVLAATLGATVLFLPLPAAGALAIGAFLAAALKLGLLVSSPGESAMPAGLPTRPAA